MPFWWCEGSISRVRFRPARRIVTVYNPVLILFKPARVGKGHSSSDRSKEAG
jgi:hypothetical protein